MDKLELNIPRFVKTDSYEVLNLDNISLNLRIGKEVKSKYANTTHFVRWSMVNGFPRLTFTFVQNDQQGAKIQQGGKASFNIHFLNSFLNKVLKALEKEDDTEIVVNTSNTKVNKVETDGKVEVTRGTEIVPEAILKFVIKDKKSSLRFKDMLIEPDGEKAYAISIPLIMDTKFVKTNITDLEFAKSYFENVKNTLSIAQLKYLERKQHEATNKQSN